MWASPSRVRRMIYTKSCHLYYKLSRVRFFFNKFPLNSRPLHHSWPNMGIRSSPSDLCPVRVSIASFYIHTWYPVTAAPGGVNESLQIDHLSKDGAVHQQWHKRHLATGEKMPVNMHGTVSIASLSRLASKREMNEWRKHLQRIGDDYLEWHQKRSRL